MLLDRGVVAAEPERRGWGGAEHRNFDHTTNAGLDCGVEQSPFPVRLVRCCGRDEEQRINMGEGAGDGGRIV